MHKTQIYKNQVNKFVDEYFKNLVDNLEEISTGEFSQAYSFENSGSKFVIRFNSHSDEGFKKEEIIYSEYSSIPTPRIIDMGRHKEFNWSLTKAYNGLQLHKLDKDSLIKVLPSLFDTMNIIHSQKVNYSGYGMWGLDKKGKFNSFEDQLKNFLKEDKWEDFAKEHKFFNIEFVRKLKAEYEKLLHFVPKERYFLHGDFGRTNIFSMDNKIEGVIDWSEAMYGDFLLDLTWIAFWEDKVDIIEEYYKFNKDNKNLNMENFRERIRLYLIFTSLNNLIFDVERGREHFYNDVVLSIKRNLKF
ncbi:MAG: aminoglycoside phosphotransferase family protein [Candidatus Dojkabacteria bacterium]